VVAEAAGTASTRSSSQPSCRRRRSSGPGTVKVASRRWWVPGGCPTLFAMSWASAAICESSAESRGIDAGILAHSDLSTQARSGSKTLRDLQHRPEEVTVAAQPVEGRLWREAEPARLG